MKKIRERERTRERERERDVCVQEIASDAFECNFKNMLHLAFLGGKMGVCV